MQVYDCHPVRIRLIAVIIITESILILQLLLFKINDTKIIKITDLKIKTVSMIKMYIDGNILMEFFIKIKIQLMDIIQI